MRDPESVEREKVLAQLGEARQKIDETVALFADTPEEGLWRELKEASAAFSAEARRLLALEDAPALVSRDLFRRYQEVLALVAKLIAANHRQAEADQQAIDRRSKELVAQSVVLLGACLLLALVCAALTARMTAELFRKMEWQTSELSRISWHLLERQETAARRFSHELHDELGQSLTALKANLMALACPDPLTPRVEDCLHLVDEAIRNVRELSQLLRPTILDDFGLDAALRSLCDGFRQRTGIEVDYASNLQGRLPEETETHLFRIAQEALTNVARHSGASQVRVALETGDYQIELSVSDNGRGLSERAATERRGFGMIGMRARARSAGGELTIQTGPGRGVVIEARVPVRTVDSAGSKLPISSA